MLLINVNQELKLEFNRMTGIRDECRRAKKWVGEENA